MGTEGALNFESMDPALIEISRAEWSLMLLGKRDSFICSRTTEMTLQRAMKPVARGRWRRRAAIARIKMEMAAKGRIYLPRF